MFFFPHLVQKTQTLFNFLFNKTFLFPFEYNSTAQDQLRRNIKRTGKTPNPTRVEFLTPVVSFLPLLPI